MLKPTYVLYHANCYDGFGAAFAAWMTLGDYPAYIPVAYGQPMPEIVDGAVVYIVDFSYPRSALESLAARCDVTVLDHHKTAQADLAGLAFATFDMNKSGAVLTWEHFHPGAPVPMLLSYVEDRDLWRFRLPESREVADALRAYPMEFTVWEAFVNHEDSIGRLKDEGRVVRRFTEQQVAMICRQTMITNWDVNGVVYRVPIVNATNFWSEVGEYLLLHHEDARFAASWFDRADGQRQWSLRSRPDFDVSVVAQQHGGGGHAQAAGFEELAPA